MADTFFQSYQAIGNREDLLDIITQISPTETPMLTRFGKTTANATYHEWLSQSLAAVASNSQIEGTDIDAAAVTPAVRTGNHTNISAKVWRISDTQEVVKKAGRTSEYAYQMGLKMKELARDMENMVVNGTGASGASATARAIKGVVSWISTNTGTGSGATATGAALTESQYNNLLQTIYTNGGNPDVTYVNGYQKRKISAFTTPSTRFIDAEAGRINAAISVYESDFGRQTIILDRYIPTDTLLALEENMWKIAYLRPPYHKPLPDGGGGKRGRVEAEYTLEALNQQSSGKLTALYTGT